EQSDSEEVGNSLSSKVYYKITNRKKKVIKEYSKNKNITVIKKRNVKPQGYE
ncbi:12283_t:CDS:1, partial [Racocetra fulgida]